MFNLQGSEIIVILLLALVVLGPEKLPDAVRRFSKTYSELRRMGTGFQSELKSALEEPMREMRETANMVRDAADPSRMMAEAEAEHRLEQAAADEPTPVEATPDPTTPQTPGGPLTAPPAVTAAPPPGSVPPPPPPQRSSAPPPPPPPGSVPPPPPPPPVTTGAVPAAGGSVSPTGRSEAS